MKQFLVATAVIAVLSLPVYYFFDNGPSPQAVARAVSPPATPESDEATPWLTEEEKQRIVAGTIEGQRDKTATAMIEGMEQVADGFRGLGLAPGSDAANPVAVASGTAADSGASEALVLTAEKPSGQGTATALVTRKPPVTRIDDHATDDDESATAPAAAVAVAAVDKPEVTRDTGAIVLRYVSAHLRMPRAAMERAGFSGDGGGLVRDYPTSFLWFDIA